jgi:peptidoglycan biosynthesis protein MviN/MurJ (putative lipid II flippase)
MTEASDPRREVIVATLVGAGMRADVYGAGRC